MPHNKTLAILYTLGSLALSCQAGATEVKTGVKTAANAAATGKLSIDACALLLPSEISKVIGLPVDRGTRKDAGLESNGAYSSACVWTIEPGKAVASDPTAPLDGKSFVILNAMQWPAGSDRARSFLQAFRQAAIDGDIPGDTVPRKFGDEALWWGDGLAVRQRDVSFGVSVFIPDSSAMHSGVFEEQLAPHILRRLDERDAGKHK